MAIAPSRSASQLCSLYLVRLPWPSHDVHVSVCTVVSMTCTALETYLEKSSFEHATLYQRPCTLSHSTQRTAISPPERMLTWSREKAVTASKSTTALNAAAETTIKATASTWFGRPPLPISAGSAARRRALEQIKHDAVHRVVLCLLQQWMEVACTPPSSTMISAAASHLPSMLRPRSRRESVCSRVSDEREPQKRPQSAIGPQQTKLLVLLPPRLLARGVFLHFVCGKKQAGPQLASCPTHFLSSVL
jgi:hypothetical protein